MNHVHKIIVAAIAEFLFLSLLALSVPLILAIDVLVVSGGVKETSLTELTQQSLLLICALGLAMSAWHRPRSRGFLVLVAGLFSSMLVRELDSLLDELVCHGFWVWPAALVAIVSMTFAITCRETILAPMAEFVGTKSHFSILFGLVILLVFSRSFGSGGLLWKHIMGDDYRPLFKAALQEGLELLGYVFVSYGTFLLTRRKARVQVDQDSTRASHVQPVKIWRRAA